MRITNLMMANNLVHHVEENLDSINTLREQSYTGKKFQNPSDDPVNSSMSLQLKSSLSASKGFQQSAALIQDWMEETEFSLQQLETIAARAKNLALTGLSDTYSENVRTTSLVSELNEMIKQTIDLGNTKFQGNYIFSGVRMDKPAFELTDPSTLVYNGINKSMMRSVGQSSEMVLNINGDEAISPFITALIRLRDNMATNNTAQLPSCLDDIKAGQETLISYRTANGGRMRQVKTVIDNLEKSDLNIKAMISEKEDVSMAEAITDLQCRENTYQAVLEVGNRTLSALNLFDYMQ